MQKKTLAGAAAIAFFSIWATPAMAQTFDGGGGSFGDTPEFGNFLTANSLGGFGCPRGQKPPCNPQPPQPSPPNPHRVWNFITYYICSGVAGGAGAGTGLVTGVIASEFVTPLGGAIVGGAVGSTVNDGVKDGCLKVTQYK
jgi:hypothetical protein